MFYLVFFLLCLCAHSHPCVLGVWDKVLGPVAERRAETGMLRLFPVYLKGEDLFGLTISAVTRITESVFTIITTLISLTAYYKVKCPVMYSLLQCAHFVKCHSVVAAGCGGVFKVSIPLWT